jgi:hypothetical protein
MTDRKEIEKLIDIELKKANEKYPLFCSPHEAYAVLQEEVDEVKDDMECINGRMELMWHDVKSDFDIMDHSKRVYDLAMFTIQEAIQVAAMCKKIEMSKLYDEK